MLTVKVKNIAQRMLACCLLAPLVIATTAVVSSGEETEVEEKVFYCDVGVDPPVTFVNLEGEAEPKAFLTWYPDYLLPEAEKSARQLCQEVSAKLEEEYQKGNRFLLAAEPIKDEERWQVCLVTGAEDNCQSEGAKELFSLKLFQSRYLNTPECIMQNKEPNRCLIPVRGPVLSIPGSSYTPFWWPFK